MRAKKMRHVFIASGLLAAAAWVGVLVDAQNEADCFVSMPSVLLPSNTFDGAEFSTSSMVASTTQACGQQYPICFENTGVQYIKDPGFLIGDSSVCRELIRYTIPSQPENFAEDDPLLKPADDSCPAIVPDIQNELCACQQRNSRTSNANITFIPKLTTEACCQQCSCIGDPHCVSFKGVSDNWVVCNARAPDSCEISTATCVGRNWTSPDHQHVVACISPVDKHGNLGCAPNPAAPFQPTMNMYTKTYSAPSGDTYRLSIVLRLGNLGNIVCVTATYGPIDGSADVVVTICNTQSGAQGIQPGAVDGDQVGLAETAQIFADTKVQLLVKIRNNGGVSERLEVWLDDTDTAILSTGGFCESGVIEEKNPWDAGSCTPSDEFIFRRMCSAGVVKIPPKVKRSCSGVSQHRKDIVISLRNKWCNANFAPPQAALCRCNSKKIDVCSSTNPWYVHICKKICNSDNDPSCEDTCQTRIKEVPNEVVAELLPLPSGFTLAPTGSPTPCPLLSQHPAVYTVPFVGGTFSIGPSGSIPTPFAYLYVQKRINSTAWTNPLLWFTQEQMKCTPFLKIPEGTGELADPGATYRVLQCQESFAASCSENNIVTASLNITLQLGQYTGTFVSRQLRSMYDASHLVCSKTIYKFCPPDYLCCIWGPNAEDEWKGCMLQNHNDFYLNTIPKQPVNQRCQPL